MPCLAQPQQALERLAIETGTKHAEHVNDMLASGQFIAEELMPKAAEAGIPFDALAKLLGISRQTLYAGTTKRCESKRRAECGLLFDQNRVHWIATFFSEWEEMQADTPGRSDRSLRERHRRLARRKYLRSLLDPPH